VSAGAQEPWLFAAGSNDEGAMRTLRLRTRAPDAAERDANPLLVMIRWPFDGDAEHLPDDDDLDAMGTFENTLEAAMSRDGWGVLVAVVTADEVREWRIYTQDFERFQEGLNDALLGLPRYPLASELFEDPDWIGYTDLAASIGDAEAGAAGPH
jgi:hypothetical protein